MGGTIVVGKGQSGIFLNYLESTYGDTASVQEVGPELPICRCLLMPHVLLALERD